MTVASLTKSEVQSLRCASKRIHVCQAACCHQHKMQELGELLVCLRLEPLYESDKPLLVCLML